MNLKDLWLEVNQLNKEHFPENDLMPILGNGKINGPKVMFVFINPTARNISSSKEWKGPRFPFIGTKQIWKIFHKAGLFDDELIRYIEKNKEWSIEFTYKVLKFLENKKFYLTNIVKWTGEDATLPDTKKIKLFLPLLKKEIEIIKPRYIVTFGIIPFERLTNKKITLKKYYKEVMKDRKIRLYETNDKKINIIPCYFPVGRGNPKRAVEILKMLKNNI